jgi:hypothetical protein
MTDIFVVHKVQAVKAIDGLLQGTFDGLEIVNRLTINRIQ